MKRYAEILDSDMVLLCGARGHLVAEMGMAKACYFRRKLRGTIKGFFLST